MTVYENKSHGIRCKLVNVRLLNVFFSIQGENWSTKQNVLFSWLFTIFLSSCSKLTKVILNIFSPPPNILILVYSLDRLTDTGAGDIESNWLNPAEKLMMSAGVMFNPELGSRPNFAAMLVSHLKLVLVWSIWSNY